MSDSHSLSYPLPPRHYERFTQPPLSQDGHRALGAAFQAATGGFFMPLIGNLTGFITNNIKGKMVCPQTGFSFHCGSGPFDHNGTLKTQYCFLLTSKSAKSE